MSGGKFILTLLAMFFAFFAGSYLLMNWHNFSAQLEQIAQKEEQKSAQAESSSKVSEKRKETAAVVKARNDLKSSKRLKKKGVPKRPTFDVVRVKPTGAIFAGRATPGWNVRLESNKRQVGLAKADHLGQWVIVLDKPLPSGDHHLTLSARSASGTAGVSSRQKVFIADVGEAKQTPKVVLSERGKESRVLQKKKEVAELTTQNADKAAVKKLDAKNNTTGSKPTRKTKPEKNQKLAQKTTDETKRVATNDSPAKKKSSVNKEDNSAVKKKDAEKKKKDTSAKQDDKAKKDEKRDAAKTKANKTEPVKAETEKKDPSVVDRIKTLLGASEKKTTQSSENDADKKSDEKKKEEQKSKEAKAPDPSGLLSVKSIAYEASVGKGGYISLDGEALPGMRIRLYADKELIGSTSVKANGKWKFRKKYALASGQEYRFRVEQVDQSGTVLARADKPYQWKLPKAVTVAGAKAKSKAGAKPAAKMSDAKVNRKTAHKPRSKSKKPASHKPLRQKMAGLQANRSAKVSKSRQKKKLRSAGYARRKRRKSVKVGRMTRKSYRPKYVVVKKGDTLWRISERVLGKGQCYWIIYRANRHKIKNPNRIYPRLRLRIPS